MTSYQGLPPGNVKLVQEFCQNLLAAIQDVDPEADFSDDFSKIDQDAKSNADRHAEREPSPFRKNNWRSVFAGDAESKKLKMVYARAAKLLPQGNLEACAPKSIREETDIGISDYELGKNGLSDLRRYLVPENIRQTGL